MRQILCLLVGLLIWGPASAQYGTKTQWGVVKSTDSLPETRTGYVLGPGAGRALKALVDANTLALGNKQDLIGTSTSFSMGTLTANEVRFTGSTAAQTAEYNIKAFPGLGVRIAGNWIIRSSGQIYTQSAGEIKTDGVFVLNNQNRQTHWSSVGVHIGANTASSGAVQITGTAGNQFRITNAFTPSGTSDATGAVGQIEWNTGNLLVKTADGWKYTPLYPVGTSSSYTLPTATASVLGGVKVGSGLAVAADGTLSATGGGSGAVSSVNGRTGAVTGLAEATGVANDFTVDGTFKIPTANDRWSGFDGLSSGQTTRFRLGDVTGAIDMVYGQPLTMRAYHGWVIQNQSGGANPALRVNGLSSGQNIFEFYDAANNLRAKMAQDGTADFLRVRFPDGTIQTTASGAATAPITVSIAATQTALLNAIAAQTVPTIITWSGSITLTQDIELRNKTGLELNCYQRGGLYRDNSPNMIIIRGGLKSCAIRGIAFSNQSGGSNGNTILINEEGAVDYLFIEYNSFTANGTENNGIASNSSGGAQDQFVTTHNNIYVRYNKFQGIPRMAVELKNHSADGPTPTWCYNIFLEYNDISDCGTGSADGYGLSLSGLFSGGRMAYNNIVNAKKYSLEGVLIANYVIEHNNVTDITTTSNGLSLSNGYKAVAQIPAGANRRVIVRNNTFNVKGRSILSYWYNNCEFTRNIGSSQQRNEWIGDDNTITKNTFDVYNDWNAMQFATANRNRIVDNVATTYYHGGGVYTSSVIFLDASANNNYVRSNTLTRPVGSYNVHIEQNPSVTNDIGTTAGSATNTLNIYVERRAGTLGDDYLQVDTYDALTKLLPVTSVTTVKVTADEKFNSGSTSEFRIWPDGSIMWQASQKVN